MTSNFFSIFLIILTLKIRFTFELTKMMMNYYSIKLNGFQVKLETNGNELHATQKQLDESQNAREILTCKLMELTNKMDASNNQLTELSKERESLHRTMETLRSEKHSVDKEKVELNLMVEALSIDLEKSQIAKSHLQKMYDALLEEKKMLDLDLQCARKDKEITEMNLR